MQVSNLLNRTIEVNLYFKPFGYNMPWLCLCPRCAFFSHCHRRSPAAHHLGGELGVGAVEDAQLLLTSPCSWAWIELAGSNSLHLPEQTSETG